MSDEIVKVQVPLGVADPWKDALVYARGKEMLQMMDLPPSVFAALRGDPKGYFRATRGKDGWTLGERTADQSW